MSTAESIAFEPFTVAHEVLIRSCRRADMAALEWFGMFSGHRDILRSAFARHSRGEAVMLIAEANGTACGQVWIDLDRQYVDSTGVLWAIRVFPCLQNSGIGTKLIEAAESVLRFHDFKFVEMTVEKTNKDALRLYERLGYHMIGEVRGQTLLAHAKIASKLPVYQWIIRKDLWAQPASLTEMT